MHRSRQKITIVCAEILFSISVGLLVYGAFLNYGDKTKQIDPIRDVEKIDEEKSTVSITPSDENTEIIVTEDNNYNYQSNNDNSSVSNENTSKPLSIEEVNDNLRKEIQKKYDIKIQYGSETNGYTVKNGNNVIATNPITDSNKINSQLNYLNKTLALYPAGLFKEIKNGGIPLTIILIDSYSDSSITGVTDSSYTYANISISAMYAFDESFYHESYHYIERYMFKNGANFNSWDSLNPSGFTWNTIDGSLSYNNTFSQNAPFVNNYAQTAAAEDRASTFEYMMADTKASCLNNGTTVWKKANYMSQMIRQVLSTVRNSSNVRWEQYLY